MAGIRRPDWVKDVPEQRTMVRRIPAAPATPTYPQGSFQPVGTFTGAGADGVIQPGKIAGDAHEGELIWDADTAQAVPHDVFYAMQQQAKSGNLDVNALRGALGIQPRPGYAAGTPSAGLEKKPLGAGGFQRGVGVPESPAATPAPYGQSGVTATAPTPTFTPAPTFTPSAIKVDTPQPVTVNAPEVKQPEFTFTKPAELSFSDNGRATGYAAAGAPTTQQVNDGTTIDRSAGYAAAGAPTTEQVDASFTPAGTVQTVDRASQYASAGTPNTQQVNEAFARPSATTATAPSTATGTVAAGIVRKGLQNLSKQMDGMSDTDRRIANFYLSNTDATNAANLRVLASQISADPYMSPQAKQSAIAGLQRDMAADRGVMAGTLAADAAQRADAAQAQGIQLGQQVRTYEDITLPTSQQANELAKRTFEEVTLPTATANLAALEENLRQAKETYANYTTPANKIALETAQANLDNAKTGQSTAAIQNRISTLFASGSVSTAKNDATLQSLVKSMLGANATPQQISDEIGKQWAAFNETKKVDFNSNAETLIGAAIDNEMSREEAILDDSIRRNVAGANGLDMATDGAKIDAAVGRLYDQLDLSDAEIVYRRLMKTDYFNEYATDTPDFKKDMMEVISDLGLSKDSIIDPTTGELRLDIKTKDWPWNAPKTFFKYNDWNLNPIDVNTPVGSIAISIVGNGEKYKNSNGQAVTNADATAEWDKLNPSEQHSYFNDDGTPNVEKFLSDKFPAVKREDGSTVSVSTPESYDEKVFGSESYANSIDTALKSFVSEAMIPTELSTEKGGNFENITGAVPTGQFLYYDEYGRPKIEGFTEGNLGYIWQQLSDVYGEPPGTLLSPTAFKQAWGEGKDWRVNSDGKITNLSSKGVDPILQLAIAGYKTSTANGTNIVDGKLVGGSTEGAKYLAAQYDSLPADIKADGDKFLETHATVEWDGSDWAISEKSGSDVRKWVEENVGKLYKFDNGRVYVVGGWSTESSGVRNNTAYVYLYDYATGEMVKYSSSPGSATQYRTGGDAYAY